MPQLARRACRPTPTQRVEMSRAHVLAMALAVFVWSSTARAQEVVCDPNPGLSDYREHTSGGNVNWGTYQDLPVAPALHAWERLKLTVTGTVNINREIYEERECNWFGLNCWYEKRVRNNIVRPENVPFLWVLRKQEKPGPGDLSGTINQSGAVIELHPDWQSYWTGAAANDNHAIMGQVGTDGINRLECRGETPVCSHGSYTIKVEIDSLPRARRLIEELKQSRVGYAGIMNESFLNTNLRNSGRNTRACTAEALLEQARRFFGTASGAAERQKILLEALNHNSTNKTAQTLLASTYLETGQFDEARKTATGTAVDNEKLIQSGKGTAKVYMELAENYATLAEVGWRETAGDSTRAALDAVGYLRQARERLLERLEKLPLDQMESFTSEDARKKLSQYSSRLAAIRARLGTEKDLLAAITPQADTLKRLPLRFPDATPYEVDAVKGTLFAVRNREPVFSDRSWQLDAGALPLGSSFALTPLYFDPLSKSASATDASTHILAYASGAGNLRALNADDILRLGTNSSSTNPFTSGTACVSHAGRYGPGTRDAALIAHKMESSKLVATFISVGAFPSPSPAPSFDKLHAATIIRAGGTPRLATVRLDSETGEKRTWVFEDKAKAREVKFTDDSGGTDLQMRVSPSGDHIAIGIRSKNVTRWRLIHPVTIGGVSKYASQALACKVAAQEANFDDVAMMQDGMVATGSGCLLASKGYPTITSETEADLGAIHLDGKHPAAPELVEALRDRRTEFAWYRDMTSPFAIVSWSEDTGLHPLPKTYKIIVVRGRPAGTETIVQPATFISNVAEWAAPETSPLTCEGQKLAMRADRQKFRVTDVSIVQRTETVEGRNQSFDRPRLSIITVGVFGSIASMQPAGPIRSARCNAVDYQDIQTDAENRLWGTRADSALVKLGGPDAQACETPVVLRPSFPNGQRVYRASSLPAEPVQVFDLAPRGVLARLTQIPLEAHQSDKSLISPAACSFGGLAKFMSCSATDIITAAAAPAGSEVRVLLRDISSDARMRRDDVGPVERPTALAIVEPAGAGKRNVRVYKLPVTSFATPILRPIPASAVPIALLTSGDTAALVVTDGTDVKAIKDETGTITNAVALPGPAWAWSDQLTRWLVAPSRLMVVRGGVANSDGEVRSISLVADKLDSKDGKFQNGNTSNEIAKQLRLWPLPSRSGQIESFAVSADLGRILHPRIPDGSDFRSWAPIDLGGGAVKLSLAGAGVPLMMDQNRIYMSTSESLVESWEIPR